MVFNPSDLAALEVALLGVLCLGLPPSRVAGDDFRVDHVAAVAAALQEGREARDHLVAGSDVVTPEFREKLRSAIESLAAKGIVADQPPNMPAAAGGFDPGFALELVRPDEHPALLDRYLGQLCMEELLQMPAVYPYLMDRYAKSGEVWRRLREEGYGA